MKRSAAKVVDGVTDAFIGAVLLGAGVALVAGSLWGLGALAGCAVQGYRWATS